MSDPETGWRAGSGYCSCSTRFATAIHLRLRTVFGHNWTLHLVRHSWTTLTSALFSTVFWLSIVYVLGLVLLTLSSMPPLKMDAMWGYSHGWCRSIAICWWPLDGAQDAGWCSLDSALVVSSQLSQLTEEINSYQDRYQWLRRASPILGIIESVRCG